ncbi:MAG: bifunctional phosphoribosyl-AMP cyclohydrolase/phosphoribosyl-ATP diphosphatase HisIE [Fusobacteriaceae bacterium]|jgi:phosphoribosyl-ATP pyrophosphohydrolase/phosphoribosyl-AMP cyclohydrolase|nr:bifunctional phosphoribosyl-AMP cyclohydrolase/phosphoribosyl-ATP diphosphatase HisIE [Fusobacteriaceae bacterium]
MTKEELLKIVKFDEKGLVPVIAQDYHSKHVRMMAWMNREALEKTLATGTVCYFSRSRQELWVKGETSGHFQYLRKMEIDCDGDCLLIQIEQAGGISCHTGHKTCFYREISELPEASDRQNSNEGAPDPMLERLEGKIKDRMENPVEGSYTNYLLEKGLDKILKKVGEEAAETIIAAKNADKNQIRMETADLLYHLTVLMAQQGVSWEDVAEELRRRE